MTKPPPAPNCLYCKAEPAIGACDGFFFYCPNHCEGMATRSYSKRHDAKRAWRVLAESITEAKRIRLRRVVREGAEGSPTALAVPMPAEARDVEGAGVAPTEAEDAVAAMIVGNSKGKTIGRGAKALLAELKKESGE